MGKCMFRIYYVHFVDRNFIKSLKDAILKKISKFVKIHKSRFSSLLFLSIEFQFKYCMFYLVAPIILKKQSPKTQIDKKLTIPQPVEVATKNNTLYIPEITQISLLLLPNFMMWKSTSKFINIDPNSPNTWKLIVIHHQN